jgi:hypothetical protein
MDEYVALAQRVVLSMDDVRGCLVLSRDGLILGAFPEDEESSIKPAWLRFVHIGEARKSFVEFGDQIWCYVHRGPYAAFVVAAATVRPGVLLDHLEQVLLVAEESRTRRDAVKLPDPTTAPSSKPRTTLHPPADKPEAAPFVPTTPFVRADASGAGAPMPPPTYSPVAATTSPNASEPSDHVPIESPPPAVAAPSPVEPTPSHPTEPLTGSNLGREPQRLVSSGWVTREGDPDEPAEIDRVLLAKEFSGLLQLDADGDEGSS